MRTSLRSSSSFSGVLMLLVLSSGCRDSVEPRCSVHPNPIGGLPVFSGEVVAVTGNGLGCVSAVAVGGTNAQTLALSDTLLQFRVPDVSPGSRDVFLSTERGAGVGAGSVLVGAVAHTSTDLLGVGRVTLHNGTLVEVRAQDVLTQVPLAGLSVLVVTDGSEDLIFVSDTSGTYAPDLQLASQIGTRAPAQMMATSVQAFVIPVHLLNVTRDADAHQPILVRRLAESCVSTGVSPGQRAINCVEYLWRKNFYRFDYVTTLGDLQYRLAVKSIPELLGLKKEAVTVAGYYGFKLDHFLETVWIVYDMVKTTAEFVASQEVLRYRDAGYQEDQKFEVWVWNLLTPFGPLSPELVIVPLEAPRSPPAKTARLQGLVLDASVMRGIENVSVQAAGSTPAAILTGPDGRFVIPNLSIGTYDLSLTSPGYGPTARQGVAVVSELTDLGVISLLPFGAEVVLIAGAYTGEVDATSNGLRLNAVFTFRITQSGGVLAGDYSISGTTGGESVTGTGTLSGTIGIGTNPEVTITSTSAICPSFSNEFHGTYDPGQGVITLTGTVHIFRISTCAPIAEYPNTVIRFTRDGVSRVADSDRRAGIAAGS